MMIASRSDRRPVRALFACLSFALLISCGGQSGGGAGQGAAGGGQSLGPATTVGPAENLLVPNSNVTCADGYPVQINASFPQPFTGQGAQSCTIVLYSNVQPTSAGVIVSATIGVGPVTGPMRFVRMRILADSSGGTACCSAEQLGDIFTPRSNGLTTVPLNLVMERGTDVRNTIGDGGVTSTGTIFNDWIGLEVLAPDVPIPGVWTKNGGADLTLPDYLWLPALSSRSAAPTQNLRSEGSFSGFVPTFNISFRPAL